MKQLSTKSLSIFMLLVLGAMLFPPNMIANAACVYNGSSMSDDCNSSSTKTVTNPNGTTTTVNVNSSSSSESIFKIFFPAYSFFTVINKVFQDIVRGGITDKVSEYLTSNLKSALYPFVALNSSGMKGLDTAYDPSGTTNKLDVFSTIQQMWKGMFNISLIFFPLVMLIAVGSVMAAGSSAAVTRAELFESLVSSVGTLVLTACSFIVCDLFLRVGWGLSSIVLQFGGQEVTADRIAQMVLNVGTGNDATTALNSINSLVLGHFMNPVVGFILFMINLLVIVIFIAGLYMGYFATVVITIVVVVSSPIVIILSGIPPLRFLFPSWLKALCACAAIPVVNAILLTFFILFANNIKSDVGLSITVVMVMAGMISLMLTVDYQIGKMVFGGIIEAYSQAGGALLAAGQMALTAATLVLGPEALGITSAMRGMAGGAAAALPSGTGGGSLPGGGADPGDAAGSLAQAQSGVASARSNAMSLGEAEAKYSGLRSVASALAGNNPVARGMVGLSDAHHSSAFGQAQARNRNFMEEAKERVRDYSKAVSDGKSQERYDNNKAESAQNRQENKAQQLANGQVANANTVHKQRLPALDAALKYKSNDAIQLQDNYTQKMQSLTPITDMSHNTRSQNIENRMAEQFAVNHNQPAEPLRQATMHLTNFGLADISEHVEGGTGMKLPDFLSSNLDNMNIQTPDGRTINGDMALESLGLRIGNMQSVYTFASQGDVQSMDAVIHTLATHPDTADQPVGRFFGVIENGLQTQSALTPPGHHINPADFLDNVSSQLNNVFKNIKGS